MIISLIKQPSESRLYSLDFAALLEEDEVLTAANSVAIDKTTASPLVAGTPAVSGVIAQVRLTGGLAGTIYKVTIVVTTSDGNTLEGEAYVNVEDI